MKKYRISGDLLFPLYEKSTTLGAYTPNHHLVRGVRRVSLSLELKTG